jgi:hypothetical protein
MLDNSIISKAERKNLIFFIFVNTLIVKHIFRFAIFLSRPNHSFVEHRCIALFYISSFVVHLLNSLLYLFYLLQSGNSAELKNNDKYLLSGSSPGAENNENKHAPIFKNFPD